jgi:hypothetical protein
MSWERLKFGKYKGLSLPQVLFLDPAWFFWAIQHDVLQKNRMAVEANKLYDRACSIYIPASYGYDKKVEYYLRYVDNRFINFMFVPESKPFNTIVCNSIRKDIVDFRVVFANDPEDKVGYRIFLNTLRFYYFGEEDYYLDKEACEQFFDDENNFATEEWPRRKPPGLFDDQLKKIRN